MPYRTNSRGGVDFVNAGTGSVMSTAPSNIQSSQPKSSGNFITNYLFPRTGQFLQKLQSGFGDDGLAQSTQRFEEERKKRQREIERIISQAKQSPDPQERKQLLQQAQNLSAQNGQEIRGIIQKFEQESGTKINEKDRVLAEAMGVAGELGTLFIPAGGAAKTATLMSRIYKTAKLGAAVGFVHGLTDPEKEGVKERLAQSAKEAGLGFVVGGVTAPVFEVPLAVARKFIKVGANSKGMNRIFSLTDSVKKQFRKSTGGMNFEEEIIVRDGKSISGKNYEQLVEYFGGKARQANNDLDGLLASSENTVNRKSLIKALESQAKSLSPEKGRLAQGNAATKLQNVIEQLNQYPSDEIPVLVANQMKRDLQLAGKAAFSASGKATPTSTALANASRKFKTAIEDLFPRGEARDANRTVQLYETAFEGIQKQADAKAKSLSGSVLASIFRTIPQTTAAGAGLAAGFVTGNPGAGLGVYAIATGLAGGFKFAENRLLSPEWQTRFVRWFGRASESQGIKNADQFASLIGREISREVARGVTLRSSFSVEEPLGQLNQPEEQQDTTQGNGIPQQNRPDNNPQNVHDFGVSDTVKIRNTATGEVKTVSRDELGQYGLSPDNDEALEGLPPKRLILAAMILDAQNGGKNITKLKTILDAYGLVEEDEETGLNVTKVSAQNYSNASSGAGSLNEVRSLIFNENGEVDRGTIAALKTPGKPSQRARQLKAQLYNVADSYLRLRTGAQANPTEIQKLANSLEPSLFDSTETIETKLNVYQEVFDQIIELSQSGKISNKQEEPAALF